MGNKPTQPGSPTLSAAVRDLENRNRKSRLCWIASTSPSTLAMRPVDTAASARFFEFQSYSAYVTLLDAEAKPSVDAYYQQVWDRHQRIAGFRFINPAVNTQNLFNTLGHTGLEDAFHFEDPLPPFTGELCHFCYEPLFAGRMMTKADLNHIPVFSPSPPGIDTGPMLKGLLSLWLLTGIVASLAYYRLRFYL